MLLEITNLTVRYDKAVLINNLSMAVDEGELVSLVGPNGAGKSTLLRAITGLVNWEKEITRRSAKEDISMSGTIRFMGEKIDQGRLMAIGFYGHVRVRFGEESDARRFYPNLRSFVNVNTPEELARLQQGEA